MAQKKVDVLKDGSPLGRIRLCPLLSFRATRVHSATISYQVQVFMIFTYYTLPGDWGREGDLVANRIWVLSKQTREAPTAQPWGGYQEYSEDHPRLQAKVVQKVILCS
jgi:hypothetical protein